MKNIQQITYSGVAEYLRLENFANSPMLDAFAVLQRLPSADGRLPKQSNPLQQLYNQQITYAGVAEWQTRTFKGRVRKSMGSSPIARTKTQKKKQ